MFRSLVSARNTKIQTHDKRDYSSGSISLLARIEEGDIIFIGADDQTPLAVVKVSAIVDLDGTQSDKYIISMKRTYLAIPSDTEEQEEDSKEEDSEE